MSKEPQSVMVSTSLRKWRTIFKEILWAPAFRCAESCNVHTASPPHCFREWLHISPHSSDSSCLTRAGRFQPPRSKQRAVRELQPQWPCELLHTPFAPKHKGKKDHTWFSGISLICSIFDKINKLFKVTVVDGLWSFFPDASLEWWTPAWQGDGSGGCGGATWGQLIDWPVVSLCQEFALCSEENGADLETTVDM